MRGRAFAAVIALTASLGGLTLALAKDDRLLQLDAELAAVHRTRELLESRLDEREHDLHGRIRALYKLTVAGDLPLWVDEAARGELVARRGAARRVIMRDLEERQAIRADLDAAEKDESRLAAAAAKAREAVAPAPIAGSFVAPVSGEITGHFGKYVDATTHARLVRHGVEIAPTGHLPTVVVAPARGRAVFVGQLRGYGTVVVLDHCCGLITVVGGMDFAQVAQGTSVEAGAAIGFSSADRPVVLEVRRGGIPVDPTPLLRASAK